MLKLSDSAGKKLKLPARGFAAAGSFNFSGRTDSFNILAKSRFHETTQKFNFDTETVTKNCHFYCQFQVKLTTKKKEPGFQLKISKTLFAIQN